MTDLHTHILPGMDDGPKDLSASVALLEQELLQGVDRIALTSHYHCETESASSFLSRQEDAFFALRSACPAQIELKRGCEVFFSPMLLTLDVRPLCLEGTDVLLLELPVLQKPAFLREVLTELRQKGITPLIAHAERYQYVDHDPRILAEWIALGAVIQINAASVINGGLAKKLIGWNLAHVIASDAHSVRNRPANLRRAMASIEPGKARELERNAAALFSGRGIAPGAVKLPRRMLGFWI